MAEAGSHVHRLVLLGEWRLNTVAGDPAGVVMQAARRALAMLALRGPLTRSELRGALWPNLNEAQSAARLRNALWRLASSRRHLLEEGSCMLRLSPSVRVDVDDLFRAAARLEAGLVGTRGDPRLFEADLLPGWDEDWLIVDRERIRQVRLHALESMSAGLLAKGQYGRALDVALAAVRADPLRESAHRAVISVHFAEGNVAEAVRHFEWCRAVLADELDVKPSIALRSLMSKVGPTAFQFAGAK